MMSDDELAELAADIKANGLREPIWVHDGRIIDGRNRYLACKRAGIEPRFKVYPGDDKGILPFVLSLNLHRRHLNESQRAAVAARVANIQHGGDRRSDPSLRSVGIHCALLQPETAAGK
jgi:ParB-like chromosome segregation protein Spo0J